MIRDAPRSSELGAYREDLIVWHSAWQVGGNVEVHSGGEFVTPGEFLRDGELRAELSCSRYVAGVQDAFDEAPDAGVQWLDLLRVAIQNYRDPRSSGRRAVAEEPSERERCGACCHPSARVPRTGPSEPVLETGLDDVSEIGETKRDRAPGEPGQYPQWEVLAADGDPGVQAREDSGSDMDSAARPVIERGSIDERKGAHRCGGQDAENR